MVRLRLLGGLDLRAADDSALRAVLGQPKRLALLAYLTIAGAPQRRDGLVALFWPDSDSEHARGALSQALTYLRQALGAAAIETRGTEEVAINPSVVWCDVTAFEAALAQGRLEDALDLYRDAFMPTFHADASVDFEQWLTQTRSALAEKAANAALALAHTAIAKGWGAAAATWAKRAVSIAPLSEQELRRVVGRIDRAGERAGAIRVYEEFAARLRAEYDLEPAPESEELIARIRARDEGVVDSEPSITSEATLAPSPAAPTPRRPILLAIGVIGVLTILFIAARTLGISPVETLMGAGRLTQRPLLLVADFNVPGTDTSLALIASEAVRMSLQTSQVVRVLQPRTVSAALIRMRRDHGERIDLAIGREIAEREGAEAVVDGDIARVGASYVVQLRLISTDSGNVLASVRETAPAASDLIGALDRVSRKLRRQVGESMRDVRDSPSLARYTTSSLPALRNWAMSRRLDDLRAIPLLREAVRLDSTFATAWRGLSVTLGNVYGYNQPESDSAAARAYRYRDRLTPYERHMNDAWYFHFFDDRPRALAAYRAAYDADASERVPLNQIGVVLHRMRQTQNADSMFRIFHSRAWNVTSYTNLAWTRAELGDFRTSDSLLREAERTFPTHPIRTFAGNNLHLRAQFDSAEQVYRRLMADRNWVQSRNAYVRMAELAQTRGRIREARMLRTAARRLDSGYTTAQLLLDSIDESIVDIHFLGRRSQGIARIDRSLGMHVPGVYGRGSGEPLINPLTMAAFAYGLAGDTKRLRQTLERYEAELTDSVTRRRAHVSLHALRGELALAENQPRVALREFGAADTASDGRPHQCHSCYYIRAGRAYDQAQMLDSAIYFFDAYVNSLRYVRIASDVLWLAYAYRRLGDLHERNGSAELSQTFYRRFLDLWKDADRELQPEVSRIRSKLHD